LSRIRLLYNEIIIEWELLNLTSNRVLLIFIFDYMSIFFLSLVLLISGSVIMYSNSYISSEQYNGRFIGLVIRFVMSIALLITRPNIISLLLGWDGLGVTSYLLVIFYQGSKSYNAGIITALTNRLGDVGILITIGLLVWAGDWSFLYHRISNKNYGGLIITVVMLSACTKSAQIPFSAWLPAAIAAPTPVSALVHSSTLVTAGVYLLIRYNILLFSTSNTYNLFFVGLVTTVIAGSVAMLEIDIKKVIALSTLRQLGVMMTIIGAGKPLLAYLHLLSHAYFKAILFICAGIIIHNIKDYQDIRTMGGMYISMPKVSGIINVANIRLCGLPFMRGFYSKDRILEAIFMSNTNILVFMLVLLATILTVCYSCRLSLYLSASTVKLETRYYISEIDKFIILGIIFLLPFSVMGGLNLIWHITSCNIVVYLPLWLKSVIIILIIRGVCVIYLMVRIRFWTENRLGSYYIRNMWCIPLLYRGTVSYMRLRYAKQTIKNCERTWCELFIYKYLYKLYKIVSVLRYSIIMNYFVSSFIIFIIFIIIM